MNQTKIESHGVTTHYGNCSKIFICSQKNPGDYDNVEIDPDDMAFSSTGQQAQSSSFDCMRRN